MYQDRVEAEQQPGLTVDDILQIEIYKFSDKILSNERYSKSHGPVVTNSKADCYITSCLLY
jgi:hypothetical protein